MHFERHAADILNLTYSKPELNRLFEIRVELANRSRDYRMDLSVDIAIIENRIKTLLCLQ